MAVPIPEEYDVHPFYGFVPESLMRELPAYFAPWSTLALHLEEFVQEKSLRRRVHELPLLDHLSLGDDVRAWRLAHVFLAAITQCYVWGEGPDGVPEMLPRQVAVPLKAVADHLDIPPFLTYHTSGLCNWKLKDTKGPIEIENVEAIVTMNGGEQESLFFCSTLMAEFVAAEGIMAAIEAQKSVMSENTANVIVCLEKIERSIQNMTKELQHVRDRCDPGVFFNRTAPFLAGWNSDPFQQKNLQGLVFEGVDNVPIAYKGLSAAPSSTLPLFDAALGIHHTAEEKERLLASHELMPPDHRRFISAVGNGPSIKDFARKSSDPLCIEMFNRCVQAVVDFRSGHVQAVTRFVVMESLKNQSEKAGEIQKVSSGNKELLTYLKGMRDPCDHKLGENSNRGGNKNGNEWTTSLLSSWRVRILLGAVVGVCLAVFYKSP